MAIRPEVRRVAALDPLPLEDECSDDLLAEMESATSALTHPLSDEEAQALLGVLATSDESTYFGMIFTVRSAVESAPGWPLPEIWAADGPWFEDLRRRARNAGFAPPA